MPDLLASASWPRTPLGPPCTDFYICSWIAHDSPVDPAVAATQAVSIVLAAARPSGGFKSKEKRNTEIWRQRFADMVQREDRRAA
jgi:hypothetical protein